MAKQILKNLTKEKVPNKILATFLVVALTFSNVMSLGVYLISGAKVLATNLSELESQGTGTESANIEFDSYYISGTGEKTHSVSKKFGENEKLYMELNIKNEGYLKNGKIEILDANFNLLSELEMTDTIQSMDNENKVIQLKQLQYDTNVIYDITVGYKNGNHFNLNDFNKTNKVKLTGTYVSGQGKETNINKEIKINTEWSGNIEMLLEQEIVKYVPFVNANGKGILIQYLIKADLKDKENNLPVKSTTIEVNVPKINGIKPTEVKVTTNGTETTNGKTLDNIDFNSSNYTYNETTDKLVITVENKADANGIVWLGNKDTKADEYIVSYIFSEEAVDTITDSVIIDSTINGDIFAYNSPNKTNPLSNSVQSTKQFTLTEKIGDIVQYELTSSDASINKGYMYTNFERENKDLYTEYSLNWIANIGDTTLAKELYMEGNPITTETYKADELGSGAYTFYRQTSILKSNFDRILGENGYIEIYDGESLIGKITKNTTPDKNGVLRADYSDVNNIIIKTNKPVEIGKLKITNTVVITGLLEESCTLQKVKGFTKLVSFVSDKELASARLELPLVDPTTAVSLEINKDRISATNVNENVEIKVTLHKNNVKFDLFKNPIIYIEFPSFVKDLDVKDLNIIYADGLIREIDGAKITKNSNGNVVVTISLKGNQTEYSTENIVGTQIVLNTDIIVKELTPTVNAQIKAYVHNEKATKYETVDQDVPTINGLEVGVDVKTLNFIAPSGVVTKGTIEGFNGDSEISTNKEEVIGKIKIYDTAKTAKMTVAVLNNYGKECKDVRILGRIPTQGNKTPITLKELNSTFNTVLQSAINVAGIDASKVKVYYSTNKDATDDVLKLENGWTEDTSIISNAKSYLIKLENYTMQHGEAFTFSYDFQIPANLGFGESSFGTYAILFNNSEENPAVFEYAEAPKIGLATGKGPTLTIQTTSTAGTRIVHEGEIIKYTVNVKNTGTTDAKNVIIKNIVPTGTTLVKWEMLENEPGEGEYQGYKEYPGIPEVVETIAEIKPGITYTLEYFVKVNKLPNGETEKEIETYSTVRADEYTNELKSASIKNTVKASSFSIGLDGSVMTKNKIMENSELDLVVVFGKTTTNIVNNIEISCNVPEELEYIDSYVEAYDETIEEFVKTKTGITYEQGTVKYKTNSIKDDQIYKLVIETKVKELAPGETSKKMVATAQIKADGIEIHRSSEYLQTIIKPVMKIVHNIDKTTNTVKEKEEIEHTIKITNDGEIILNDVETVVKFPENVTFISSTPYVEFNDNKIILTTRIIPEGSTVEYKFIVRADTLPEGVNNQEVKIDVKTNAKHMKEIDSSYSYTVEKIEDNNAPSTYSISGTAWVDENKDGEKGNSEKILSNIRVLLLDGENEQKITETKTGNNGMYVFNNIIEGDYVVVFIYDSNKYELTTYKKSGILENVNSDVTNVSLIIDGVTVKAGLTDKFTINNSNIYNLDIGLIEKAEFDLNLNKTVSSITVKASNGQTMTKQYNGQDIALLPLNQKIIEGSEVTIEYKISIKNEGDVPGYAKKIVDYLPKDIVFDKDLNPNWLMNPDGNIYNTELSELIINPGETKEIKLILNKFMTKNNTGLISNTAEIYEDYNDKALKDKDSTVANQAQGEDDMSLAEALITVATGEAAMYLIITLIAGAILGAGIFIINKKAMSLEKSI